MKFMAGLYKKQVAEGRVFLHEHPAHAKSWNLQEVRDIMRQQGVQVYEADQCMYGLFSRGQGGCKLVPAKKPRRFMTNSRAIGRELQRRCDKTHPHQTLVDGRASEAARYPDGLCRAICRGIVQEQRERTMHIRAVMEVDGNAKVKRQDP